jgi:preprotein translocase subunit SecF
MHLHVIPHRRFWILFSAAVVGVFFFLIVFPGPRFGIEFTGGTLWEVAFQELPPKVDVVAILKKTHPEMGEPVVNMTTRNSYILRFKLVDNEAHLKLLQALRSRFTDLEEVRFTTIGPTVGTTLRKRAILAAVTAVIAMILYITFAFRRVPMKLSPLCFGLTTIIALFHDMVFTIGLFAVLSRFTSFEVDTLFLTALLTVFGYSVNDTIVVFDRIRENMQNRQRDESFAAISNKSVNQSLVRSINTGITTLLVLFALLVFGGETIRWFILTLAVGISVGTYSSIFVATPLLVVWQERRL